MAERDAKGRFIKGNKGNPNPVCRFAKGNIAAIKHYGYADGYMRRVEAQFRSLTKEFLQLHPEGSEEELYHFIKSNWNDVVPTNTQEYRSQSDDSHTRKYDS